MRKSPWLAIIPVVFFALIPDGISFRIYNPPFNFWMMLVLLCGSAGLATLFIKTSAFVKMIALGGFISCFFSICPLISFTSYVSLLACSYFFILCSRIDNWTPIKKAIQVILLLNVVLIFMQSIGRDILTSFGQGPMAHYGIIGQHMQMASFTTIATAFLISLSPLNFIVAFLIAIVCTSTWTIFSIGLGLTTYLAFKNIRLAVITLITMSLLFIGYSHATGKFSQNMNAGRLMVWKKTIELTNKHPLSGYGPGSYQAIFPELSKLRGVPWKTAHNDFAQVAFETGYPGLAVMAGALGFIFYKLLKAKMASGLSGLVMVSTDMLVHFPMRSIQMVLLLVMFLGFCVQQIRKGEEKCLGE